MATSIYFNGRVTSIPGSYSEVDASGLASVGLGASGIVACIGEVEGSEPGVVQSVSNPGKLSKIFRSGDLLEAGTMLFDPSKDPDIPGGAQEVKFVKVNPATKSSKTFQDSSGSDSVTFTSKDWGAFTEKISVDISAGTDAGTKAVTVSLDSNTETFDNIGGDGVATLQYTGEASTAEVSFASATTGLSATVSDALTAAGDYYAVTPFVPGYAATGEAPAQPNGTETLDAVSTDGADTFNVTIYGKAAGVADTETLTLTGSSPVAGSKVFTDVYGVVFTQAAAGTVTVDGNTSGNVIATGGNTTATIDFAGAPLASEATSGTALKLVADGATTDEVIVVGTASSAPAMEIVALNGTSEVTTTTLFETVLYVGLGKVASGVNVQVKAEGFNQTAQVSVQSTDAADTTQSVSIYGIDGSDAVQSETVLLNGTSAQTSTGTYKRAYAVELSAAAAGTVSVFTSGAVRGTARDAVPLNRFSLAPAALNAGMDDNLGFALNGTALSWSTAPVASSTAFIVIGTSATGAAQTVRYTGASGTTAETWATIESITTSGIATGVTLTATYQPWALTVALYPTFDTWENFFSDQTEWTLTKDMSATSSAYNVSLIDDFTSQSATGAGYAILDILNDIVTTVNAGSAIVAAARATGATLPPANTPNPVFLTGGGEGSTSFSDWQAALDTLRDYRVNTIVVMTADAAVHAAVIAHCVYMCGPGRSERDCLLGMASGTTLSQAKAGALAMNTRHSRLFIQDIQRFNTDGEKERFAPPFTACLAAGMQAGSSVGTSLTFKFLNVLNVYGDSTYTIMDDANELINSGLCMVETVPNRGWRWLRNVTTYLIDNNLAYTEGSVNEAVNYAVYNLRQSLEAIVGQKGFAGTVTAAEGIAISILGQLVIETVITSYRNLDIVLEDDVMTIDVEVAPVIPVNFVKTTIHLVSASFANE